MQPGCQSRLQSPVRPTLFANSIVNGSGALLVVECREHQHTQSIPIMDRRTTVSGVDRGAQRAIYNQRRREVLPEYGIELVELSFADFAHHENKRLRRCRGKDMAVVRQALARWIR